MNPNKYPGEGRCDTIAGTAIAGGAAGQIRFQGHNGISGAGGGEARRISVSVDVVANTAFENALTACKAGCRITRYGWNAGGQHVEAQYPDKGAKMSVPYLVLKNAQNEVVPWVPSQGDIFANDWAILPR